MTNIMSMYSMMYLLVVWLFTNWPAANGLSGLSGFKASQEKSYVNWDPFVSLREQDLKGKIIWIIIKEFQKEKQYI